MRHGLGFRVNSATIDPILSIFKKLHNSVRIGPTSRRSHLATYGSQGSTPGVPSGFRVAV